MSTQFFTSGCLAYTALAGIDGRPNTFSVAAGHPSQDEANQIALAACRSIGKQDAEKCYLIAQATSAGFGALVCATSGCGYVTGYGTAKEAEAEASRICKNIYQGCNSKPQKTWTDSNFAVAENTQPVTRSMTHNELEIERLKELNKQRGDRCFVTNSCGKRSMFKQD